MANTVQGPREGSHKRRQREQGPELPQLPELGPAPAPGIKHIWKPPLEKPPAGQGAVGHGKEHGGSEGIASAHPNRKALAGFEPASPRHKRGVTARIFGKG